MFILDIWANISLYFILFTSKQLSINIFFINTCLQMNIHELQSMNIHLCICDRSTNQKCKLLVGRKGAGQPLPIRGWIHLGRIGEENFWPIKILRPYQGQGSSKGLTNQNGVLRTPEKVILGKIFCFHLLLRVDWKQTYKRSWEDLRRLKKILIF